MGGLNPQSWKGPGLEHWCWVGLVSVGEAQGLPPPGKGEQVTDADGEMVSPGRSCDLAG